jgi:hypothetical protein
MKPDLEGRAVDVLRAQPTHSLPLQRLHRTLVAEVGPMIGSPAQLAAEMRRRADLFVVIEPRDPLGETVSWPRELRAAYEDALRQAGVERDARIALRETQDGAPDALVVADRTLVEMWRSAHGDERLCERIATALAQLDQARRSLQEAAE